MSRAKSSAIPVFLAFLAMGFGDAAGSLVGPVREQFHLSNFAAQLVPFVGMLMFGVLSVPMGVWQDAKGKKFILMLGLAIMLGGLVIPSFAGFSTFPVFLVTMLLLGAGATTLQVAGNPIMRDVSPEGKYSRNLSLGQFVKAIGSLSGPLIPVVAARWFGLGWSVIFPVYSVAVLLALLAAATLKSGDTKVPGQKPTTFGASLALLGNGYVALMVLALFLYVGAEVSVSSGIPLYLKERFQVDINRIGLLGTGLFFAALTIGRFSGGVILNYVRPQRFFVVTSLISLAGLLGLFAPSQTVAVASFLVIGLGFANIFPLIFSMVIDRLPQHANALSGLMVMAIVGGAIVPPLTGLVADTFHSVEASFLVPVAAIVYIGWSALVNLKQPAPVRNN
jgi:fucose permease